ncbi:MAG: hypothetical protein ABI833_21860 [Acidobacteriota bacterium]
MGTRKVQTLCIGTLWIGLAASVATGESYPQSWNYIAPDASAIVGVEWQQLRGSFLAEALGADLSGAGRLGFPDLACLRDAREILLAGPDLLGVISGPFPAATVAVQAASLGMRAWDYDGVRMWIASGTHQRSVAQVNDTLLLIGFRDALEAAIDRSLLTAERQSSPLLARAAHLAATFDLWITATSLPDPLVTVFIPLAIESADFDGGVKVRHGLTLDARYYMATPSDAELSADYFREAVPGFHPLLRGMYVIEDGNSVRLKLQVPPEELAAQLRPPEPAKPAPVETKALPETVPAMPRSVRILGLDDGPREFPLPAH